MNNFVFTIVAKNYLPLAKALGWSIKNNNTMPVTYVIFVADEMDDQDSYDNYDDGLIIPVSTIGIKNLKDWAFKYNVTEFCTAVKPGCFKHLITKFKAEKIIFFDPDVFVFNDLDVIFNDLNSKDIVVTPHYLTQQVEYTGDQKETSTLFVGIFNFGFVAFKVTEENCIMFDWWENRLSHQCYADKQDALHTDQKWADFFQVYAFERLLVSKSFGYNVAPWNLFERKIVQHDDNFFIRHRFSDIIEPLTFVHFAGYDVNNLSVIHKDFWDMSILKYPEYDLVRNKYIEITNKFDFGKIKNSKYGYGTFTNGIPIYDHQRRLYRSLTENGSTFEDPFSSDQVFFKLLQDNKLIIRSLPQKQNRKVYNNFDSKLSKINRVFRTLHRLLGSERYFLLMRLLNRYSRPENQVFLLKDKISKLY